MKRLFLLTALLTLASFGFAQGKLFSLDNLQLSTRADFTINYHPAHDTVAAASDHGFSGKYLVVALDGTIGSRFSYHLRQRINTPNIGFANTFFQGTDWAYLNWNFTDNLFLSAGKQVVAIGGWEYDTNPIDIYYGTEFWNTVCCYEVGASLNFKDDSGKNHVLIQMCNSPFINQAMQSIYAYNLMWYGNFGAFKTAYSTNIIEYQPGKYINYIALGNKLQFNGVEMYLDVINRASFEQKQFFGQDLTAIYGIGVDIGPKWIVFAKAGYDFNRAQLPNTEAYDQYVTPGKKVDFESLGFEYYPMGGRNLRLHLCGSHTNVDGVDMFQANLGLTWKVDLLHVNK
ncbi:MAG: hypothetical protein IKM85_05250 [Bacteroidales bacterium]|nr:hypothetical protein [Bacteroidales bacterium]